MFLQVDLGEYRMELWPGYVTSIRQHESKILMCSEITHKVMRRDTVLDFLKECYQQNPKEARKLFERGIIGAVVLTDYNNRTYRIDDVDWDNSPKSTFKLKTNEEIAYSQYFKEVIIKMHELFSYSFLVHFNSFYLNFVLNRNIKRKS